MDKESAAVSMRSFLQQKEENKIIFQYVEWAPLCNSIDQKLKYVWLSCQEFIR